MNTRPLPVWVRRMVWTAAFVAALVMGYFLKQPLSPKETHEISKADIAECVKALKHGSIPEREDAAFKLIQAKAEDALSGCLVSDDELTTGLATQGLWECWLNEKGVDARKLMDKGVAAMNSGKLDAAEEMFRKLMKQYPDWAEAINKEATVLYLLGHHEKSLALCKKVVALKPNHFGAWSGMAMCAMQTGDWTQARRAAREALRIQPNSIHSKQMLKAIEAHITDV